MLAEAEVAVADALFAGLSRAGNGVAVELLARLANKPCGVGRTRGPWQVGVSHALALRPLQSLDVEAVLGAVDRSLVSQEVLQRQRADLHISIAE